MLLILFGSKLGRAQTVSANASMQMELARLATNAAKREKKAGHLDLAKIYYLNALNHAPSEVDALKAYADLVLSSGNADEEEVERLKSVAQIALYQVSPDRVPTVLAILNRTTTPSAEKSAGKASRNGRAVSPPPPTRFEEIAAVKLESLQNDDAKLEARSEELASLADEMNADANAKESELGLRIQAELKRTQEFIASVRLMRGIDQNVRNLGDAIDRNPVKAFSIIQAAEATLGQLWGLDLSALPVGVRTRIDRYPEELNAMVEKLNEKKSEPLLVQARELTRKFGELSEAPYQLPVASDGPLQTLIVQREQLMQECQRLVLQTPGIAARQSAEKFLIAMQHDLATNRRHQYERYQKWVVSQISPAFNSYQNKKFVLDGDVQQWFEKYSLARIDETLLSPGVARLFADVLQKFLIQLPAEMVVDCEKKMAESKKVKLENF